MANPASRDLFENRSQEIATMALDAFSRRARRVTSVASLAAACSFLSCASLGPFEQR